MPPADRLNPVILDHFDAILEAIQNGNPGWPVGEWQRPEDLDDRFVDPPFALVRIFPSAEEFEGTLADAQQDINLRFQVMGVGGTHRQALSVTDKCRSFLQPRSLTIPNRYVQSLKFMVVSGGISRDDDVMIPFFQSVDLYELKTTPA